MTLTLPSVNRNHARLDVAMHQVVVVRVAAGRTMTRLDSLVIGTAVPSGKSPLTLCPSTYSMTM